MGDNGPVRRRLSASRVKPEASSVNCFILANDRIVVLTDQRSFDYRFLMWRGRV